MTKRAMLRHAEQKLTHKNITFNMCNRETPFQYTINPTLRPAEQRPIVEPISWERTNKILLLRNDGKFGNFGNQINALLHAYDYARDNKLHLGILFHSWAMDAMQTMFYETDDFDALSTELLHDLGIVVVRNKTQLEVFDEVVATNSKKLYFYKSYGMDTWRETMEIHIEILQRLFLRYNRGTYYVQMLLCTNVEKYSAHCMSFELFFHKYGAYYFDVYN